MTPTIQCLQLAKRYGRSRGIEDLTLTIEPGEVFGFLGPNGAGKTTTIRTLLDLHRATSGTALIFGLDITNVVGLTLAALLLMAAGAECFERRDI